MTRSKHRLVAVLFLVLVTLTGCNYSSPTEQSSSQASVSGTSLPSPVSTSYRPQFPTPVSTESPIYPTSAPRPSQVAVTPDIEQFKHNPPSVTMLAKDPIVFSADSDAMVWTVQGKDDLTLWLGYLTSQDNITVKAAHPVAKWNGSLSVVSIVPSPDRNYLAVLLRDSSMGFNDANLLWTVNLTTNLAQSLPNLAFQEAYRSFYSTTSHYIIGWLDSNRIVLQTNLAPAIIARDGSSFTKVTWLSQPSQVQTALSPDRTTFFSEVISGGDSGYWLYQVDGSNPRKVSGSNSFKPLYEPKWSADNKHISFLTSQDGGSTSLQLNLLETTKNSQQVLTPQQGWDASPAWSPDGSRVAFLRANSNVTNADYQSTEQNSTNIFIAKADGSVPTQLTHLSEAKNRALSWTSEGKYLVLSSTDSSGKNSIVSVSASDGSVTTLIPMPDGYIAVFPLVLK